MNRQDTPHIDHISWGRIEVQGIGCFKDAKVFPGGARIWDWRETGTHHVPGIQPSDIKELLEHGAEEIVLSRGSLKALKVCPETLELLDNEHIPVHVLQTKKAVEKFNQLRKSVAVAGLFHSTC